ncbi:MAG TPA: ComEC/Rec2 family competence protein [Solirubrobacterales bacterium]|nr:ComEC/Rec2 family competence protein [Solirubrobacterales bacterium]
MGSQASRHALAWRHHAALTGLIAGLLLANAVAAPSGWAACAAAAAAALGLAAAAQRARPRAGWPGCPGRPGWQVWAGLAALAAIATVVGLGLGSLRLRAIDAGALRGSPGQPVSLTGFVSAPPRRGYGEVRVQLDTPQGRIVAVAPEPVPELDVGTGVAVRGRLRAPEDFHVAELARAGAALEVGASRIIETGSARAGIAGALDRVRGRAEAALGEGLERDEAALARGFVLGQDDRIEPAVREQFRRAGLSHLLAVSGQNVALLAILAGAGLALVGVGLRARLLVIVAVIALYVPIAGAGPSIQRAGVMGAAAIVATLAGRPGGRAYPVLLAAAATLILNPRSAGDVGWQLSFAAVIGIALWAAPVRELIAERLPSRLPRRAAQALSEGAAMTMAATVATAPLIAHDFERLSAVSVAANLLALPAVAPVMWVGMLIGLLGQVPAVPTAPLGAVEGVLIDYVALVARTFGSPAWAEARVALPGTGAVIVSYLLCSIAATVAIAALRRRRRLAVPAAARLAVAASLLVVLVGVAFDPGGEREPPGDALRVTALDVGQGDATLIEPPRGAPVLVDGGPPGDAAASGLDRLGVERLAAVFVTHDQSDHAGGLFEVLATRPVGALVRAAPAPRLEAAARAAGVRVLTVGEGSGLRFGPVRIDVLWPPRDEVAASPGGGAEADPNVASLVTAARYRSWDVLLTGDAEAEATHLDPGPFDVLKVAHHGSDDAGLGALLDRSAPRVALIGVGADNPYGHPTEATLATLAERSLCVLRTDLDGDLTVAMGAGGLTVETSRGPGPAGRPGCAPEP